MDKALKNINFAPAVGYCIFGERVLKEYTVSVRSLDLLGKFDGDIIVASDFSKEKILAHTPEKYKDRLKFVPMLGKDIHDFQCARLNLFKNPILHPYNPFVYMDADILVTAPIESFLRKAAKTKRASAMAQPWMHRKNPFLDFYRRAPFKTPEKMSDASYKKAARESGCDEYFLDYGWQDTDEKVPFGKELITLRTFVYSDKYKNELYPAFINGGLITIPSPAKYQNILNRPFEMATQWLEFRGGSHSGPIDEMFICYAFAQADFLDPLLVSKYCLPSGGGWSPEDIKFNNYALQRRKEINFLHFFHLQGDLKGKYMAEILASFLEEDSDLQKEIEEDKEMAHLEKYYILDNYGHILDYDPFSKEIISLPFSKKDSPNLFLKLEKKPELPQVVSFHSEKGDLKQTNSFLLTFSKETYDDNIVSFMNKEDRFLSINPSGTNTWYARSNDGWEVYLLITEETFQAFQALAFSQSPTLFPPSPHSAGGFFQVGKHIIPFSKNANAKIEIKNKERVISLVNSLGENIEFKLTEG